MSHINIPNGSGNTFSSITSVTTNYTVPFTNMTNTSYTSGVDKELIN